MKLSPYPRWLYTDAFRRALQDQMSIVRKSAPSRALSGVVIATTLAVSLFAVAVPAQAASYLDSLRALSRQANVSAMVIRLDDMAVIDEINADQRLTPASVSKLYAAAAALEQFGPAHRFTSRFTTNGSVSGNALNGNLIFVGGGDPALDNARLWSLINGLRERGISRVNGDLVVDDGLFGSVPCLTKDRCDAQRVASHAYSAPLSSAGVNFATIQANVYAGERAGDPARVELLPRGLSGYRIANDVSTGLPGTRPSLSVWRTYDGGQSTLHLRGSLPMGTGPYKIHRAVTGPAQDTARVIAAMLHDMGITVTGNVRVQGNIGGTTTLAHVESDTLAEQLIPLMAYSNNYMADTLTLDLAADSGYNRPLTLPLASQALEALADRALRENFPMQAGAGSGAVLDSGSGLAVSNKLSARDLVALLSYMYRQPSLFPAFYGSIPVPLSAPSRTLKQGNFDWLTRINAKTGTLSEPVTVRALAGYFRLQSGGYGAFAFVINGTSSRPSLSYRQTVTAYQTDMESILADY
ncbi:D-alanyl-D-alanine carboxypeptidase/D-alanyl-D-alanine-endopeptidase [Salinisphaera sp. T5B8]|uniref:D-alanyl-D-alanine carboxypeptidase/D-alanyl-D-alanine endopeptidase n=1 Tax=Salinisphaera sp. T5B8 TaxID=1304154 RepID=UPI00333FD04A